VLSYSNCITLGTFFETVGKRGAAVRARVMRAPASRSFESPEGTYLLYVLVTSGANGKRRQWQAAAMASGNGKQRGGPAAARQAAARERAPGGSAPGGTLARRQRARRL
jgi:hypothetical protein